MLSARYRHILSLVLAVAAVHAASALLGREFYLTQLTMTAYYTLVVIGLCLLMGYAGQISLGHAGFFAIGGYTSAVLTTLNFSAWKDSPFVSLLAKLSILVGRQDLYGGQVLSVHPWVAFFVAVLFTLVIAYGIGVPVLKLKGHYLAMATLASAPLSTASSLARSASAPRTGSPASGVPPSAGLVVSGRSAHRTANYYIAWGLVTIGMALLINLIGSRVGRALRSIHGSEDAASAMGVDTARYKLNTFVLSAVLASIAGVFLTHYNGGIGPSEASVMKSVRYVAIVAVGGMASLWGTLIMSTVLNFLSLRATSGASMMPCSAAS